METTEKKLLDDLDKLITLGQDVISTGGPSRHGYSYRNDSLAFRWRASCLSFFSRVFGASNHYSRMFTEVFEGYNTPRGTNLERAQGILSGAKDDIESGALRSLQTLTQAEIFSELLEQAEHLQQRGYSLPAAVIAGAVLEDGLRKLCNLRDIELNQRPTLGPMNDALAKSGAYSSLVQKQITALADLRNRAAHGKSEEFTDGDVERMLIQVRDILGNYLR